MFINVLLIISCFVASLNAGISSDTPVYSKSGAQPIKVLKVGDKILAVNMRTLAIEEGSVSSIAEVEVSHVVEITTSDNVTFCVAADQKLFVTHKWVEAQQLTLEDVLMTKDRTFVKIVSIRHLEKPMTLNFITVDEYHNFFAAENGVLIHNGPICGALTYLAIKGTAVVGICVGTTVVVGAAIGTIPVTGTVVGGMAAAGVSCAAPAGVTATVIAGGAAGAGGVGGTIIASTIQGAAALGAAAATIETAAVTASLWIGCCPFLP